MIVLITFGTSAMTAIIGLAYAGQALGAGNPFIVTLPGQDAMSVGLAAAYLAARAAGVVGLVVYVLRRAGEGLDTVGLSADRKRFDLTLIIPFAVIALSLQRLGFMLPLAGASQGGFIPVPAPYAVTVVLRSLESGVVEELVVLGFVITRLRQIGVHPLVVIAVSALLRASYHLEYGWAAAGPLLFGVGLASMYMLTRRLLPAIAVHAGYDIWVSFQNFAFG